MSRNLSPIGRLVRVGMAGGLGLSAGWFGAVNPVSANQEDFAVALPLNRAAMAEYTVVCDDAAPCETVTGQNVPGGQTDGKRLLVGRENADDPGSDDAFVLLSEFDLGDIPSGLAIASATMRYQLSAGAPDDLEIRSIAGEWSGSPFAELPSLGEIVGQSTVTNGELIADVTEIVREGASGDGLVDVALVPTHLSGFGQVFSPTANPAARRPVLELLFIADDAPPSIALTAPSPGPQFGGFQITADASDNVGVARVELYIDGQLQATDAQAPWEFEISASELDDGPHYLTVRAVDAVGLSADDGVGIAVRDEWSTPQRLDYDLAQGDLTLNDYATFAVDYAVGAIALPVRYAASGREDSLSGWFTGVLAVWPDLDPAVRDSLNLRLGFETGVSNGANATTDDEASTDLADQSAQRTASAADPACAGVVVVFPLIDYVDVVPLACTVDYGDFNITYPTLAVGDFSLEDLDANGIPDEVDDRAESFEQSLDYYVSDLGFEPRDGIDIVIVPFISSGLSIPNFPFTGDRVGNIFIGAGSGTTYLPSHEIFHQVQYNYFSPADFSYIPNPFGGYNAGEELDSIRWFMEASAEWGSHKWLESIGSDIRTYAGEIDVFLGEPHGALARNEWTNVNGPQYGAFVVPEYLESRAGTDLVREVWEEVDEGSDFFKSPHVYASMDRALNARGLGGLGDNALDMWRTLYDLDYPDSVATQGAVQDWRDDYLADRLTTSREVPTIVSDQHRMARLSDRRQDAPPGDAAILLGDGDVASVGEIDLADYGGAVVEIKPEGPGILYLDIELDNHTTVDIRALESYGGAECAAVSLTTSGDRIEAVVPFPSGCHYVAVLFANGSSNDQQSSLDARFGDQPDKTIDNGTIRLGINNEGHLNVPGFDPSSGTGTSTVGLRLNATNADALAPGCECEGWGIGERFLGFSGWANNSYGGTDNLTVEQAEFEDDTATSRVRLADAESTVSVEHHFRPVPNVPYLYAIDVTVTNITGVNSDNPNLYYGPVSPVYRRVMDWDVEPTAFSEYVTIASPGGIRPPEIVYTSNDGFGSPDPLDPFSDLGAVGLFEDVGPQDHGAMIQIDLGTLDTFFNPTATFTMYYGAAPDEATALAALAQVDAELYSLAQPDTPDGATTGEPNTFIWGYKAGTSGYNPPAFAARTASTATELDESTSLPGVVRQ